MPETSPHPGGEQESPAWTAADLLSAIRIPLAVAFPLVSTPWRFGVLAVAAATDLFDGPLARRYGSSRGRNRRCEGVSNCSTPAPTNMTLPTITTQMVRAPMKR